MKSVIILLAVVHLIYGDIKPHILFNAQLSDQSISTIHLETKPATENCDDVNMNMCQKRFNAFLGINDDADFHNVQVLYDDVMALMNKGVDDGLLKLCQARSLFYQCLGTRYSSCINLFHFLSHGVNSYNATRFVQTFAELEFMCNGGLLQSIQKWPCILQYLTSAQESMKKCDELYWSIAQGTNVTARCEAAEMLMLCYRVQYYYNCGEDVAWWACEQARVALNIDDYCPHLSCSYQTFGTPAPPTATHPSGGWQINERQQPHLLTRRELFRSPNPGFMSPEKMNLFIQLGAKSAERARKKRSIEDIEE